MADNLRWFRLRSEPQSVADEGAGSVSVGSSTTEIFAANDDRQSATIVNDSDEEVYLGLGVAAVMNKGIRLNAAGGSYEINLSNPWVGTVNGICASGSKVVTITEVSDGGSTT